LEVSVFKTELCRFIELTRYPDSATIAVNPAGIAAFGPRMDNPARGCWISFIGEPDDLMVSNTYQQIKEAIMREGV
jgi:hypothetical protein